MNKCFERKRVKKRTSSLLPLEFSEEEEETDGLLELESSPPPAAASITIPRRYAAAIYAIVYFLCMIVVDFTIEGTQNAFPALLALPYAMTLFQFGWCFVLPVAISKGKTIRHLPKSVIAVSPYIVLSLVVFGSNVCKSASARYVSFPTKVIFRSTKLIPVMIVASILKINSERTYGRLDFLAAVMLCAGAAGYSFGEHSLNDDKTDSYFGILLLTGSVLCDAWTPNIQQWLMHPADASSSSSQDDNRLAANNPSKPAPPPLSNLSPSPSMTSLTPSMPDIIISDSSSNHNKRVIPRMFPRTTQRGQLLNRGLSATSLMTNAYAVGCVGLLLFMFATGHLSDAVKEAMVSPHLFFNLSVIGMSMAVAVFCQTRLIKESGAVAAVTVTTLREFVTVLLSYLIYPKIFSMLHAVSAVSVFGGIVLSSYAEFSIDHTHNSNNNGDTTITIPAMPSPTRRKPKLQLR